MLTQEQNDRLTQVGPGTPMGELMRRYWHPIAGSSQLDEENPTKAVRLLGEDLVLYRDASGTLGLIEPSCPHRKASLLYGIPEPNGIRCCYHGWVMNETGACVEQPSEPQGSRFKEKVRIKAYPVQELGGLVFAYLGPAPAPLLPRYDILVWPGTRDVTSVALPCNWLQCQENSLDPVHFQWLHRYWGGWVMNRKRPPEERDQFNRAVAARGAEHRRIGFELTDYGIIKRRLVGDETEDDEHWRIGHPILFPNILRVVNSLQFRVPVDDTHTIHLVYQHRHPEPEALTHPADGERADAEPVADEAVPFVERSAYDDDGRFRADYVLGQDQTAWAIQGPVTDRTTEQLGVSDVGIIMYRHLLEQQLEIVEDGGEPMNVHRDPSKNECIVLPVEHYVYPGDTETGGPFKDFRPGKPDFVAELSGEGARLPEWSA